MTVSRVKQDVMRMMCTGCLLWTAAPALAAGTVAGTDIVNTAEVSYTVGTALLTAASNAAVITVAEIIDVDVVVQSGQVPVAPGATNREVVFTVTNTGNGNETFTVSATSTLPGDDFDPVLALPDSIFFDTDASGDFSAADVAYVPGTNDPDLAPDETITMLVLNDIPGSGVIDTNLGRTRLLAAAVTGTGVAGTVFAGAGDAGVDAMTGATEGDSDASGEYLVQIIDLTAVKSATISDPFGSNLPVPGATITYRIVTTVTGTGVATGATVSDDIPAHTTYVPGSMTLNGAALTDAPDTDAGLFDAGAGPTVTIEIGDLSDPGGPQVAEFKVVIN